MDELPHMSDRDLAQLTTAAWGERIGLTPEAISGYVESCGKTLDQFYEFNLNELGRNELEELIPDSDVALAIYNVFHYQLFLMVLPSMVGDDESKIITALLNLNSEMTKTSLLWAYLKGYQQGQNAPTADAFNDFISDLDLDD